MSCLWTSVCVDLSWLKLVDLVCQFNSLSVSPSLSPSWWRCGSVYRVEFWPVPTFSVSTQSFSCRWTRRSPRGLAPSVTSPLPLSCSLLMGREVSSLPWLLHFVDVWTLELLELWFNPQCFHWLVCTPGGGVYLWFVVSLLLPSCPPSQHSVCVCSHDLIYWSCALKKLKIVALRLNTVFSREKQVINLFHQLLMGYSVLLYTFERMDVLQAPTI